MIQLFNHSTQTIKAFELHLTHKEPDLKLCTMVIKTRIAIHSQLLRKTKKCNWATHPHRLEANYGHIKIKRIHQPEILPSDIKIYIQHNCTQVQPKPDIFGYLLISTSNYSRTLSLQSKSSLHLVGPTNK